MKVALLVEGQADQEAFPTLVAKVGLIANVQIFAPRPIKAGNYPKLVRPGGLEQFVELGTTRQYDAVVVVVDTFAEDSGLNLLRG